MGTAHLAGFSLAVDMRPVGGCCRWRAVRWELLGGETKSMIYTTQRGESFDLEKDFSSPERHILQKLFIWKDMAASVEEFRLKKQEALQKGWGDSGPIQASRNLESITRDFEAQVGLRVRAVKPGQGCEGAKEVGPQLGRACSPHGTAGAPPFT